MKVTDRIHRFSKKNNLDGLYRLRIFCNSKMQVVAVITSVGDKNPSTSIQNAIEVIIEDLISTGVVPMNAWFIEHYEKEFLGKEKFLLVKISEEGYPDWKELKQEDVACILECSKKELESSTLSDDRLIGDLDRLGTEIAPSMSFWQSQPTNVLKRHIEIEKGGISKKSIQDLIDKKAKEEDFLVHLRKDLSVFGEIYAQPHDDYIIFSEFPIGKGFVDFLILTGVSFMDVILVEVKGADFNMYNQSHYDKPARNIEVAIDQIRTRMRYITENLQGFRSNIHSVRESVEQGEIFSNSFIGPRGYLEVDPEKDITIHAVVIGGKSVNDLKEAKKRHEYSSSLNLNLKLESWDTWVRKLRRK